MYKTATLLASTCLLLLAVASTAHAKPDEHPGKGNSAQHARDDHHPGNHHNDSHENYIGIDEQLVRSIFHDNRDYLERDSLPPGIRKNLARGKPLPPGIAKQIDPRLSRNLPHYDGYDWRQVGEDAVLISVTTGIVEAIINDVFD
ncbi:MAG: anti-virulence regulator CigR family protein [Halopseudomonas sp.]|uniref:anti-virulence regulator CigR family protein n=1 Tax=Halopseudomonas sp. TaxID=2901191 RepID=UPI003002EE6D